MSKVDLSQLAVDRGQPSQPKAGKRKRAWLSRYVLPLGIVGMFAGLLGWAAKDSVLPSKRVRVVPVLVARAEVQEADAPMFQAAGWVEPRPVPIVISALAEGVVEELHVVAGQRVAEGEIIARLIVTDARIARDEATAELRLREAEVAAARAELENAQMALERPIQLQADLAEADSALAQVEAELDGLPAAIEAARTRLALAEENLASKQRAGGAIAGRVLREAKADLATTTATLRTLVSRQPVIERQRDALGRRRAALVARLDLKLEEQRRLADAQSSLAAALARRDRGELAVEAAELRLARMTIKSPINGRVLAVQASPGKRVNGLAPHLEQGASAVVTLYDPQLLQVRVDVRLEDVPQVQLGQQTLIETASAPAELRGEVISVTSVADIQKNTLQVKVAIVDPPDVVRPEMLAQVTFLAPPPPAAEKGESEERLRILIPRQLAGGGGERPYVWIADQTTKTARRREITLGRAGTEELVEVASGLLPTDKLISSGREGLEEGQRICIAPEDASLGMPVGNLKASARTAESPSNVQRK